MTRTRQLLAMALISTGVGLTAAAVAGERWRRRNRPAPNPPRAHRTDRREPGGGWEARWASRAQAALGRCQGDPRVTTMRQAVSCALSLAFPEAGPWTGPENWVPWMVHARDGAATALWERVARDLDADPQAWHVQAWLLDRPGPPLVRAASIWPTYTWPPTRTAPAWQTAAWDLISSRG